MNHFHGSQWINSRQLLTINDCLPEVMERAGGSDVFLPKKKVNIFLPDVAKQCMQSSATASHPSKALVSEVFTGDTLVHSFIWEHTPYCSLV